MFNRFLGNVRRFLFNEPKTIPQVELEVITADGLADTRPNFDSLINRDNLLNLEPLPIFTPRNFQFNLPPIEPIWVPTLIDLQNLVGNHEIRNQFAAFEERHNRLDILQYVPRGEERNILNLFEETRFQQQQYEEPQYEEQERKFFNDKQNTHHSEVNISINASVNRLKARYFDVDADKTLEEIKSYLANLAPNKNNKFIITCFKQIQKNLTVHDLSKLKLIDVLILIWKGIHDESALVEDVKHISSEDIEDKRRLLLNHLYQAQTEYGTGEYDNACFMGTYNKIIETLNKIHPDVLIITGTENILPVAIERTSAIIQGEFNKKPIDIQKLILKHWDNSDPEESKTIATKFREEMVIIVNKCLENEFIGLLTQAQREGITSQFEYLPPPKLEAEQDQNFSSAFLFFNPPQPEAISNQDEPHNF